jgi:AcrR family transcriptional regulator
VVHVDRDATYGCTSMHTPAPRACAILNGPMATGSRAPGLHGAPPAHDGAAASGRNRKLRSVPRPRAVALDAGASRSSLREAKILHAVIEELARSDYGGLAFERVAARAGVNKTTVYRHWETKADLVRAALSLFAQSVIPEVSAGTLREDLIRVGRRMVDFSTSFEGQCLVRLRLLQHPEPELASIAKDLHAKHLGQLAALAEAATQRGELPRGFDVKLLLDMLGGALHVRLFMKNEPVDDVLIARMVDILLHGVGPAARRNPDERKEARRPGTRASLRKAGGVRRQ